MTIGMNVEASVSTDGDYGHLFDEEYFRTGCGPVPYDRTQAQWPVLFGRIADGIIRSLQPRKVLDAGCALGFLVEAFWDRGVEAWGIDISPYAIANVRRDMQPYCRVGSLRDPFADRSDLISCTEVLEHMPETDALEAIRNMASATDTILFSSTPFDVEEATHVNVKPTLVWLELFARYGFSPDLLFDASFVAPHAMLLRRRAPHSPETLHLFSECIRLRHTAVQHENRANQLAAENAQRTASQAQAESNAADLQAELVRERDRTDSMRALHDQLAKEARELRERIRHNPPSPPAPQAQPAAAHRGDMDALEARLTQGQTELRANIARLERRTADLDRSVQSVAWRIESILNSRIWKTLASAGGIVLRLTGRRG
jgi:SAM-dependent methyltransferase